MKGWVTIEPVQEFVKSDKTPYHSVQLKKQTLKPMEKTNTLEVDPASRRNKLTYPSGTRIRFR
jgi:hypothetical protein